MRKYHTSIICLVWLISVSAAFGCFITNCPPGGKRSGPLSTQARQCESCGPEGSGGRCYGPNICCSPGSGCLIGTPETVACRSEARFSTPCLNPGISCSGSGSLSIKGQCTGDGICCSSETCTHDENCWERSMTSGTGDSQEFNQDLPLREDRFLIPLPATHEKFRSFPISQIIRVGRRKNQFEDLRNHLLHRPQMDFQPPISSTESLYP